VVRSLRTHCTPYCSMVQGGSLNGLRRSPCQVGNLAVDSILPRRRYTAIGRQRRQQSDSELAQEGEPARLTGAGRSPYRLPPVQTSLTYSWLPYACYRSSGDSLGAKYRMIRAWGPGTAGPQARARGCPPPTNERPPRDKALGDLLRQSPGATRG